MRQIDRLNVTVSLTALLASGLLVTIATAGALIGFGLRSGQAWLVFRQCGRNVLGNAGVDASTVLAVLTGIGQHLVVATLWGMLLSVLTLQLRTFSRVVACVLLVPLYVYIVPRLVPAVLRIGHAVTSRDADLFPIAAAISVALLGGAWVAKRG